MSTLATVRTHCNRCEAEITTEVAQVLNFDRRPDLRDQILSGELNRVVCASCGHRAVIQRTVATFDFGRRSWIYCYPDWAEVHWKDLAAATQRAFDRTMRTSAPRSLVAMAGEFTVRVVFGYDALREQLLLQDHDLDPRQVEYAKLHLLAGDPARSNARLLLWQANDTSLTWLSLGADKAQTRTTPRALLALPSPNTVPVHELGLDPFFSFRRWTVRPRPADPLAFDLKGSAYAHAGGAALRRTFDDPGPL